MPKQKNPRKGPRVLKWDRIKLTNKQRLNVKALNDMNAKYRGHYRFAGRDPIADHVESVMDQTGLKLSEIAKHSSVSISTLYNLVNQKTKRPQNATIEAILRSCGYHREIVRDA